MDILNAIFTFGPVAIAAYAWGIKPYLKRRAVSAGEQSQPALTLPEDSTQPLALAHWLAIVNDAPDTYPHLAIIGPTGSGKTTTARAVLGARRGHIAIITAKEGDDWGLPYIGIDDDGSYRSVNAAFLSLDTEVKRRLIAMKQRRMTADWLTVVLDDYSVLRKECDNADAPFKLIARLGRSLRVRLIVLSDSALVKAWGIEGEGETRGNFTFVQLKRGHSGTIELDDKSYPIDTSSVQRFAGVTLAGRAWQMPRDEAAELAALIGLSTDDRANSTTFRPDRPDQTRQTEPSERTLMRKYRAAGLSREQARALLQQDGYALDNNIWADVGKELTA